MKRVFRPFVILLAVALLGGWTPHASASHFRFANLSWKRAPGTNSLAVEITVTEAWRFQAGGTGEISYQFGDGTGVFNTSTATRIATLADTAGEQYEVWRYTTSHTYPSNGVFSVFGSSCCRISSLVNAADASESFTLLVDLRDPSNTGSPVTTAPVILQMQAGTNNSIALPIVDPDGDAFTVRVATGAESSIFSLPSVGGNTLSVSPGGVLNWNTAGGFSGQKFALQVLIEERRASNTTGTNGLVPLDFIIELAGSLTNQPPTVTGTNGSIVIAPNQMFSTTFVGTDPNGGPLRINHQGLPPGATITPGDGSTNASPASVTFSWTPAPADIGSSYAVLIFFTDEGGLQTAASFALTVSASATVRDFELVSINAGGTASGRGASLNPVVSSNGQYVAFASEAANLVANDTNGTRDVFWRDRVAGVTRLVSRTPAGFSGNRDSDAPVISPDGRYVAFHSRASNLVANDSNTNYDVFIWDATDNSVTLVSRTPAGAGGAGDSFSPQLSASGRVVSFASTAPDLVSNDTNGTVDAFARDLDLGVTYLASINTNGFSGNGSCGVPVLSANGRHVAFLSRAGDLVTNDFNNLNDVFVHDLQTRETKLVSVNVAGTDAGNRLSFDPVISADGRYLAFASQATNLVTITDTNDFPDVFVRDMQQGVTRLVSVNGSGTASGGTTGIPTILPASFTPFLSADGTKVLFVSLAQDLVANDANGKQDVFLRDHINGTTTLISTNRFGLGSGNAASGLGAYSMSADLRYIAFFSEAANLGAADTNSKTDVFVRDLATNSTKIISRVNLGGFSANGHSYQPVISADGSTILFTSEADNLDNRDTNRASDVFAAATTLGAPSFGVADVGVTISSVPPRTVGGSFTLTITVTNHSATLATGLVIGSTTPEFLQFLSATASQGVVGTNSWLVGDLAANGSATATITLVATRLGEGNLVASIIRRDQLDSNLNNNAVLSTVTANQTAAGALFYLPGDLAYLSRTNSPFFAGILSGTFTLETFESGAFNIAGVTASAGSVLAPSAITDSVDADDGAVDGSGIGGRSFFVTGTNAVTFFFNPAILGRLPTKAGIVLTDGDHTGAGIEAFDTNGVSLGVVGPAEIGDHSFFGETAEDRFLGVEFAGGISALRVYYASAGFELDHLQFDIPTTDLALSLAGPASASFGNSLVLTYTVTNQGSVLATGVVLTNANLGPAAATVYTPSQGSVSSNGTWTVGALAPGAGATLASTFAPTGSGTLAFAAGVSSAVGDSDLANNLASLTVPVPNQAPNQRFASNNLVVPEDLPALLLPAFAQFSPQETNQTITNITVSVDDPSLFTVPPAIQISGELSLTLAANKSGTTLVTVVATDDGGTANGGVDKTTNTFTLTVTSVNDAPAISFTTNTVVVLEDAGAQTVTSFVAASVGPVDESAQSITNYAVANNNPALFAAPPAIALNGTLTFTPAANANGSATVTVIAQDDGGTANGGVDRTTNTFTLTVTPVNDAPSFTFATNVVVVLEDAGLQTLPLFVTAVTGPADEALQTITNYSVTAGSSGLFAVQPAVDLNGKLTFTPAANANGSSTVTVIAQDDGGTTNGGLDRATNTFTITITSVNDAPVVTLATNLVVVPEDAPAQTLPGFATATPGAADESAQSITNYSVANNNPALFAVPPAIALNGTLSFTPAASATGSALVTLVSEDDGGTADGGVNRTTNTFTITVTPVNNAPSFAFGLAVRPLATNVTSWGWNDAGQQHIPADFTNAVQIAGGGYHVIGLRADGTVVGWADASGGQLAPPPGLTNITAIAAGSYFSLALKSDGTVVAWGDNSYGQLDVPPSATDIIAIAAGDAHSLALTRGGQVIGWGFNDYGQTNIPVGLANVTNISANGFHNLALKNDGTVVAWGKNVSGQSTVPPGLTNVIAVSAGFFHSLALKSDGTVAAWGANDRNQTDVPADLTNAVAIAAGVYHNLALRTDGTVVAWGYNDVSQTSVPEGLAGVTRINAGNATSFALGTNVNFGPSLTVLEDSGVLTLPLAVTNISAGPVNEAGQLVTFLLTNSNPDLFGTQPAIAADGTLTFTPALNAYGFARVTVVAQDDGGVLAGGVDKATNTFVIVVTPVNDPPSLSLATNQVVVLEDAGAQTLASFATGGGGVANESGQRLVGYQVGSDTPALFSVQPAIAADGTLSFTPATNASGTATVTVIAQDSGGTANGGVDTKTNTFTLTITAVNDAPILTLKIASLGVAEDIGLTTFPNLVDTFIPGPANETSQTVVRYLVDFDNAGLFAVPPAVDVNGTLTFQGATNATGTITVTVRAEDSGDNLNGGTNLSAPQTFFIFLQERNDPPAFTFASNNVTALEDAGAVTVPGFIASSSVGPAQELASQLITNYAVSTASSSLFSVQPAIATNGTLTFTAAANAFGVATITVIAQDNGGTGNSGVDRATNTFTITLGAVNDPPALTFAQPTVTVLEDAAAQTVAGFVTASAGPANEAAQGITNYAVTAATPALFSVPPSVASNGTLTFTPAANANGSTLVTVIGQDDGGIADGGVDKTTNTFTITITAVNDAPAISLAQATVTVLEDAAAQTVASFVTVTSLGPVDESSQNITNYAVANNNTTLFSAQPAISLDGTLTFTPAADANGSATVTVIAQDDGGTANAGVDKTTNTFTITLTAVNDAPSFTLNDGLISNLGSLSGNGASSVLLIWDDLSAGTLALKSALEAAGLSVTLSTTSETNYTGSNPSPAGFDAVIHLNGSTYDTDMPLTGQNALVSYVQSGGTFVGSEWNTYELANGRMANLRDLILFDTTATGIGALSYTNVPAAAGHPVLTGVAASFSVAGSPAFNRGQVHAFAPNPATVLMRDLQGNAGVAVRFFGAGRVVNFSHSGNWMSQPVLSDANIQQLYVNSARWNGTYGVTVLEDSGPFTLASAVTNILTGPADESGQVVTFVVTNSNNALFLVQPYLDGSGAGTPGTLRFTPATNANGTAIVGVVAQDDGGILSGGVNASGVQTFAITVTAVNDAPVITVASNTVYVAMDASLQTLTGFATFTTGDTGQTITNTFTSNNNPALFAVQPSFATDGTLSFTPAARATGSATVTVVVTDSAGTGNGGVDRATNTFALSVVVINSAPSFTFTSIAATDGVPDWVRSQGSFFGNEGRKVAVDGSGNVIVAGEVNAGQTTDIIVVKYAPDGTAQWTNTFDGPGAFNDTVGGLAVDSSGNVYVTGGATGSDTDFVTLKYAANGTPAWTNYYGGVGEDVAAAIVVNQSGDVIVTGSSANGSSTDYLTIKYASDGTPVWTNRHSYSGPGSDYPKGIAVDSAGDVYVTGEGSNTDYTYAHTLKFSGANGTPVWTNDFSINADNSYGVGVAVDPNGDVLVAANYLEVIVKFAVIKYSSAGLPLWTNLYDRGSGADQHIRALATDSSGNPIVTGDTYNGTDYDFTTIKYLNNGTPLWTNHYNGVGGGFDDQPNAVTVNSSGDVYVTGQANGANGKDFLTVKYTSAGSGVWTNRYNGTGNVDDVARALAVDTSGNVYVTGTADDVVRTVKYAATAAVTPSRTVTTAAGTVTVTNFLASTSVGAADLGTQLITNVNVSSDNSALFSTQPAIGTNGTLTFTVSGFLGTAVVSVSVEDNGGTLLNGTNTSAVQTFTITVVNAPGAAPLSYVWQGGAGSWRDPAQWLPVGVPGPNDSVAIAAGTVSITNGVQVAGISFLGGTIDGAGLLSVRTNFTWSAGTLTGSGSTLLESGVALNISGGSSKTLTRRLDNHGTVTFAGTGSLLGNTTDTVIYNHTDGVFDIQVANGTMLGTTAIFTNAGTLKKSVGNSMVVLAAALHSTGTVYVQLGNLSLTGGGTLAGVSTNVSGQVFELRTGTFQWLSGMQYVGAGVGRILTGATVDIATNVTVTIKGGGMQHLGGTLGGAGNVEVQAFTSYIWSGGSINGSGMFTLATNATMLVAGSGDLDLGRRLDNYGTVSWSAGRLLGNTGATINNYAGALINTTVDATLFESFDATTKTLNNYGTVRKATATGTSTWHGVFNNNGTVNVQTGTLNPVGTVTLNTSTYSGAGRFLLGDCTVNGTLTNASGSNVEFAGGTLSGTGTIIGTLNWTGGIFGPGGTLTIATNGVLVASGVADKSLNRRLDNLGTITWTGGRILGDSSPVLNNLAGAVFDNQTDTTLFESNDGTVKTFNNSGMVKKTAGTGTSTWNGLFNNNSTLNVQTGTIALAGGGSSSGTFTNATGAVTAFTGGTQVLANGTLFTGGGTNQIAGGTVAVVTNGTASVTGTFELVSGVLGGDGAFLVPSGSQFNWKGGVMSGTGTTTNASGGTLTVSTVADKSLNRRLDNSGTVTWTAGRIIGDETPVLNNYAGALFDTQVDATLFESNDGTVKTFNNSGTVRKSGGTGTSQWLGVFNHSGIADVQTGTLHPAGTVTLNTSTNLGPGRLYLTGCTVNGTITNAVGANVEFASGTLSGTGTIIGTLNWTGGIFGPGGTLTIATNGTLVAGSLADKSLNRQLDNLGTITWTAGRINGDSSPVINNQAGALFDVQTDARLFDSNDGTVKTFNNSGTVRKSAGAGTGTWSGLFNNASLLSVQSGSVSLAGGGASSGAFTVANGTFLCFTNGTQVLANGVTFSGAGVTRIVGGTVEVVTNGTASVTGTFELLFGVLGGDGTFNVPAGSQFNWNGGTMSGAGRTTIASLASLTVSGSADKSLNRRLENNGTVLWTAGRIIGDNSPVIDNNAGAVFETQVDATLFESNDGTVKTFNNSGTVIKSAGTGTSTWNGVFNQSGTLEIRKGIVSLAGNFSPTAGSAVTIYLGGLLAGTQSGQLQVGGTATLTGTLNVVLTNSFLPVALNVFPVFTSASRSGTFATLTGDNLGGNLTLIPSYVLGDLNLVATLNLGGLPRLVPQVVDSGVVLRWPADGAGYELQTAIAITGPWTPVLTPVSQENGDSVIRLPAAGTRFYRLVQPAPPRPVNNQSQ